MKRRPDEDGLQAGIAAVAERMRGLCMTFRMYEPKSRQHVSLDMVEKWAVEIEACLKREAE